MIIKLLLIIGIGIVFMYVLRHNNAMRFKAGKKILFLIFILTSIVSILYPDILNVIARYVGVTRGADLLLYILIVAFIFFILSNYLKLQQLAQRQAEVIRSIA